MDTAAWHSWGGVTSEHNILILMKKFDFIRGHEEMFMDQYNKNVHIT